MEDDEVTKSVEILLVEDNPGDVRLTKEALKESKMMNVVHVVEDGIEALAFLRKEGKYKDAITPGLILLDLNLPKKDGREVLAEIKNDDELRMIPVVVMTVSKSEEDVLKAYGLHANCYISKPFDLDMFIRVIKAIDDFWLTLVRLPKGGGG